MSRKPRAVKIENIEITHAKVVISAWVTSRMTGVESLERVVHYSHTVPMPYSQIENLVNAALHELEALA